MSSRLATDLRVALLCCWIDNLFDSEELAISAYLSCRAFLSETDSFYQSLGVPGGAGVGGATGDALADMSVDVLAPEDVLLLLASLTAVAAADIVVVQLVPVAESVGGGGGGLVAA